MEEIQGKSNINNELGIKPKKFVFHISPENVEYVESLSYHQKNEIINNLINDYKRSISDKRKEKEMTNRILKIIAIILLVIVGIPLFFIILNFFLDLTIKSYYDMQIKFEQLF